MSSRIGSQIIKQNCRNFSDGIFEKGIAYAIGALSRRYTSVAILANSTEDFYRRVSIIGGFSFLPQDYPASKKFNSTIIRDYF
jgi:hypothetical protein